MNEPPREIVVRLQLDYPAATPPVTVPADQPLLCTVPQTAKLLAIGETQVRELCYSGDLGSVKIGTSLRIPRAAIDRYVRQLEGEGGHAA